MVVEAQERKIAMDPVIAIAEETEAKVIAVVQW
jgi:hypothetical protein